MKNSHDFAPEVIELWARVAKGFEEERFFLGLFLMFLFFFLVAFRHIKFFRMFSRNFIAV
jgi:hypothetical protein